MCRARAIDRDYVSATIHWFRSTLLACRTCSAAGEHFPNHLSLRRPKAANRPIEWGRVTWLSRQDRNGKLWETTAPQSERYTRLGSRSRTIGDRVRRRQIRKSRQSTRRCLTRDTGAATLTDTSERSVVTEERYCGKLRRAYRQTVCRRRAPSISPARRLELDER